jgi:hypothetical protein
MLYTTSYIYPMRQYDNTKKNDYYKGQCNWKGLDKGNSFGGYKYKENTDIDSHETQMFSTITRC